MDARRCTVDIVRMDVEPQPRSPIRFDRNELSGAFGDMGTDLPLLIGMIVASGLDPARTLLVFGAFQIATGIHYRIPMPVQPLKVVAAIVIAQRIPPEVLLGGGLAIGLLMLVLTGTGLLDWIARVVPHVVIRGLQLGLGLQLALVALRDFIPSLGAAGYLLAAVSGAIVLVLFGNRRVPPAPLVIAAGMIFALVAAEPALATLDRAAPVLPALHLPAWADVAAGFLLLALPQVPLSVGNSVLATRQLARDLFPERPPIAVRRIGFTYAAMNLVAPFVGGVPVCHGSGGMAGHHAHGGRTGGSVVIYGGFYVVLGLLSGGALGQIIAIFPRPMLGVLLLVEAVVLVRLLHDLPRRGADGLPLALGVGLTAVAVPYGYAIALILGTIAWRVRRR